MGQIATNLGWLNDEVTALCFAAIAQMEIPSLPTSGL
jgi:hypothetical protein